MHERFDVPEPPEIVVEDSEQERLGAVVVMPRITVPMKPFIEATVIVERPGLPVVPLMLVGLTVKPKSGGATILKVTPLA